MATTKLKITREPPICGSPGISIGYHYSRTDSLESQTPKIKSQYTCTVSSHSCSSCNMAHRLRIPVLENLQSIFELTKNQMRGLHYFAALTQHIKFAFVNCIWG